MVSAVPAAGRGRDKGDRQPGAYPAVPAGSPGRNGAAEKSGTGAAFGEGGKAGPVREGHHGLCERRRRKRRCDRRLHEKPVRRTENQRTAGTDSGTAGGFLPGECQRPVRAGRCSGIYQGTGDPGGTADPGEGMDGHGGYFHLPVFRRGLGPQRDSRGWGFLSHEGRTGNGGDGHRKF